MIVHHYFRVVTIIIGTDVIVLHIRNIIGGPGHVIVIERKTKHITKFGRKVEEEPIRMVVDGGDIISCVSSDWLNLSPR